MYKCQITGKTSKLGEKLNRIVVSTRDKVYTQKVWEEGELVEIEIGKGWEVVKEVNASNAGVEIWNNWTEDERAWFVRSLH